MTIGGTPLRALVRDMLALVDHEGAYAIGDNISGFSVDIAQSRIDFAFGAVFTETALERLASAIEARIAFDRARAMLVAAGSEATHFPLWLISGSAALAKWFVWSRMQNSLRRVLAFSDHVGLSPIYGQFERPTRRAVGQGAAKIRIRGGEAIAERIELPGRHRCTLTIGTQTRVRIEGNPLPETVLTALSHDPDSGTSRRMAAVIDHPFFAEADLRIGRAFNDGQATIFEIEDHQQVLAPIPDTVWSVLPQDADPAHPWRATAREIAALYTLVDEGRRSLTP